MARILAQAGIRAVDEHGNDASALAARPRLAPDQWHLWPCNLRTWRVWASVQTQWRTAGMGEATGLDYAGVWAWLNHSSLPPRRRRAIFVDLQAMERAALDAWAERAERERNKQGTRP